MLRTGFEAFTKALVEALQKHENFSYPPIYPPSVPRQSSRRWFLCAGQMFGNWPDADLERGHTSTVDGVQNVPSFSRPSN